MLHIRFESVFTYSNLKVRSCNLVCSNIRCVHIDELGYFLSLLLHILFKKLTEETVVDDMGPLTTMSADTLPRRLRFRDHCSPLETRGAATAASERYGKKLRLPI